LLKTGIISSKKASNKLHILNQWWMVKVHVSSKKRMKYIFFGWKKIKRKSERWWSSGSWLLFIITLLYPQYKKTYRYYYIYKINKICLFTLHFIFFLSSSTILSHIYLYYNYSHTEGQDEITKNKLDTSWCKNDPSEKELFINELYCSAGVYYFFPFCL